MTAPKTAPERVDPPLAGDELTTLTTFLDYHRDTLEVKCAGLTPDQLRARSASPSSLSLLGLVRHLAEVERSWFRRRLCGEDVPYLYCSDDNRDGDFDDIDTADVDEAFNTWRAECVRSRAIVASAESLDVGFVHRGEHFSLRWVLVHLIEEYARHNGHADLLRERIDGATGE
jgi:hypothetical protein